MLVAVAILGGGSIYIPSHIANRRMGSNRLAEGSREFARPWALLCAFVGINVMQRHKIKSQSARITQGNPYVTWTQAAHIDGSFRVLSGLPPLMHPLQNCDASFMCT